MPGMILNRIRSTQLATLGQLFTNGAEPLCDTLERGPGPNRRQLDRIPAGEHPIRIRKEGGYHQRAQKNWPDMHRGMIEIIVPDRTFILIHWGNYWRDTLGCILVGSGTFIDGDNEPAVASSRKTYARIYSELFHAAEADAKILIRDEPTA